MDHTVMVKSSEDFLFVITQAIRLLKSGKPIRNQKFHSARSLQTISSLGQVQVACSEVSGADKQRSWMGLVIIVLHTRFPLVGKEFLQGYPAMGSSSETKSVLEAHLPLSNVCSQFLSFYSRCVTLWLFS